jgi:hypothetical protein
MQSGIRKSIPFYKAKLEEIFNSAPVHENLAGRSYKLKMPKTGLPKNRASTESSNSQIRDNKI